MKVLWWDRNVRVIKDFGCDLGIIVHKCSHCCCFLRVGRQAVLVMACENMHMSDDLILDPGIVMIFAHGVE